MTEDKIVENQPISKVRIAFDKYKSKSEKEITLLTKQNEKLKTQLSFFMFNHSLYNRLLSDEIMGAFNMNNTDNKRIMVITEEYKKWENGELPNDKLPLELKLIMKELG